MTARRSLRRLAALAAALATTAGTAVAASARPAPVPVPGGLTPSQAASQQRAEAQALATTGCISDGAGVCVVKDDTSGRTCQTGVSQSTPPSTIKVLLHTPSIQVVTVPFQQYVENVLPNEWIASWDLDALKAGAVAVKSYAWYWVTHYGGYLNTTSNCFDVTDDTTFQVYRANSAQARTNTAVVQSWPVAARKNGQVIQASYRAFLSSSTESCGTGANGTVLSQWGSQNCVEENTGNKYNVILQKYYGTSLQLATPRQRRTPHDFTFDQTSTIAAFAGGDWAIDDGYGTTFHFGWTGDVPVITDNGDGFAHIGVWRPSNGTWYLASPTGSIASALRWGWQGDVPVPGHYAGNAQPSVPAVFRPSNQRWYVYGQPSFQFGVAGDVPVPADYNGDGTTDVATFRPSNGNWYMRDGTTIHFGWTGDIPAPADYTGDGRADLAVFRPSNGTWYVRGQGSFRYGWTGDVPLTGDFTGDGRADLAVYRPANGRWYVSGLSSVSFGAPGVTPIGAAPYRA